MISYSLRKSRLFSARNEILAGRKVFINEEVINLF